MSVEVPDSVIFDDVCNLTSIPSITLTVSFLDSLFSNFTIHILGPRLSRRNALTFISGRLPDVTCRPWDGTVVLVITDTDVGIVSTTAVSVAMMNMMMTLMTTATEILIRVDGGGRERLG